jgi:tRNA(fMet)-specific endonuclease VapC
LAEYLLDTDHLSYVQEAHPQVLARLRALGPEDQVFTSVVNVAELLRGVYLLAPGRRQRELLRLYREAGAHEVGGGQGDEVLPITRPVAEQFAETDAALRRAGRPIPINDVWLAALALVRGAVLLTNDDHFGYVPGLATENWTR